MCIRDSNNLIVFTESGDIIKLAADTFKQLSISSNLKVKDAQKSTTIVGETVITSYHRGAYSIVKISEMGKEDYDVEDVYTFFLIISVNFLPERRILALLSGDQPQLHIYEEQVTRIGRQRIASFRETRVVPVNTALVPSYSYTGGFRLDNLNVFLAKESSIADLWLVATDFTHVVASDGQAQEAWKIRVDPPQLMWRGKRKGELIMQGEDWKGWYELPKANEAPVLVKKLKKTIKYQLSRFVENEKRRFVFIDDKVKRKHEMIKWEPQSFIKGCVLSIDFSTYHQYNAYQGYVRLHIFKRQ
eukprot:TRINITY_DN12339_c0_g1_i1.p1 TRINITY_DN12339_c0_g1~~TRINITY_DN12339_c0_g1_i1.p1  ORF type:complete len:302 (+),score=54.34 TRINITY_DN12339_c0_g1_i1:64-969(+)